MASNLCQKGAWNIHLIASKLYGYFPKLKDTLNFIYFYNNFPMRGWAIPRIIVYRLMNRQELFHGDLHLMSVCRAEQGYRGASRYFPFPGHTYELNKHTWNVTFLHTL